MRDLVSLTDLPFRIISGGETGVERAALDALIEPVCIRNRLATSRGYDYALELITEFIGAPEG